MEEPEVILDESNNNDVEEFNCDICKISYTSDSELRDHIWSLMHHIKIEQKKKGSVHNCNLCFTSCPNIIEYGKHLNQEKHKKAIEENRRQKGEEDLLIGKNILFAKMKRKVAANSQQQPVSSTVDADVNLSDPETSRNLGRKRNQMNKRGKGHQRSFSLPNPVNRGKRTNNGNRQNTRDKTTGQRQNMNTNKNYNNWRNHEIQGQFSETDCPDGFYNKNYNDNRTDYSNDQVNDYNVSKQPNGSYENPHWHMSSSMFEQEQPTRWGASLGYQNDFNTQGMWGVSSHDYHLMQQNQGYEFWRDDYPKPLMEQVIDYQKSLVEQWNDEREDQNWQRNDHYRDDGHFEHGRYRQEKGHWRENHRNPDLEDSSGQKRRRSDEKNSSRKERRYDSPTQPRIKDAYQSSHGSLYEDSDRSGYWNDRNDMKRYDEEFSADTDRDQRHQPRRRRSVRFSDEVYTDNLQVADEADSTTDLEGRDKNTHHSSTSPGSKNSDEKLWDKTDKKKNGGGIMKRKKKSGKISPTGTPKQKLPPMTGIKSKTETVDKGSSVLEKAEKLCRELREKREAAKAERENKEKQQKMEKQEELNKQLQSLSEKNKEYVKGHVSAEEKRASENCGSTSNEQSGVLQESPVKDKSNANIDKIRENIEKSVRCLTQKEPSGQSERESKSELHKSTESKSRDKTLLQRQNSDSLYSDGKVKKVQLEKQISNSSVDAQNTNMGRSNVNTDIQSSSQVPLAREVVKGLERKISSHSDKSTEGKVSSQPGKDLERQLSSQLAKSTERQQSNSSDKGTESVVSQKSSAKKNGDLPTESLLKMVNSPRSRKERLKLAEILRSHASSRNKLSLPRYNLQMSGLYDELEQVDVSELGLEDLSPDVQLQIAQLIEADVKPDINELERTLFSNSSIDNSASVSSTPTMDYSSAAQSGTPHTSLSSGVLSDPVHKGYSAMNSGMKSRSRSVSLESDSSQKATLSLSHVRMETDQLPELLPSDLATHPVVIKQEKFDSGYEKSSTSSFDTHPMKPGHLSDKCLDDISTATGSSRQPSDMDVDNTVITKHLQTETQNSYLVGKDSDNASNTSVRSSFASSAANIFHTVYDISVKEETIRNDMKHVDKQIGYLEKVIEEASVHLNRYKEKKRKFQQEEEDLRKQRLKILQDAKNTQMSGQPTPVSSEIEAFSDYSTGQPPAMKVPAHTLNTAVDSYSSLSSKYCPQVEPERDNYFLSPKSSTTNNSTSTSTSPSDPLLQQLKDLSSSLQKESHHSERMGTHFNQRSSGNHPSSQSEQSKTTQLPSKFSVKEDKDLVSSSTDLVLSSNNTASKNVQNVSTALMDRDQDRSITNHLPPPLEPSRDSKTEHTRQANQGKLQRSPESLKVSDKKPPAKAKSNDQREAIKQQIKLTSDGKPSLELKDVGFVTLNSLMEIAGATSPKNTSTGQSQNISLGKPLEQVNSLQSGASKHTAELPLDSSVTSKQRTSTEQTEAGTGKVNVQYMGSLPSDIDYNALFKQNSYMVLDGSSSSEVYKQIQALLGKGEQQRSHDRVEVDGNTGKDHKSKVTSQKLTDVNVSDSNYESINSNCSLGEKIRKYAKTNKSPKVLNKRKKDKHTGNQLVFSDSESDRSDRTLQDDPTMLSDSATPVRSVKECSKVLQNLNSDVATVQADKIHEGELQDDIFGNQGLSPSRKKLKTKKERDRTSARKQKEEHIIDSSSEGTSHEGDKLPKMSNIRQQLLFKSVNDIPAAVEAEGFDPDEAALVETGSDDSVSQTNCPAPLTGLQIITGKERKLLEEVQLDSMTDSEDNRTKIKQKDSTSESKFRLTAEAVDSLRTVVKKSLHQKQKDILSVMFSGPAEVVTGLQVVDESLYVSYQGRVIHRFDIKTGKLENQYNSKVYSLSCLHISKVDNTQILYGGGTSHRLVSFDCSSGKVLNVEHLEGKIQCLHENWGKLYIGTDCGTVIVKSLKYDKILDTFMCADRPVSCITSGSEGMRKIIIIAAYDSIIFVYDASTGLLIRMLEGHTKTSFSLQVDGHVVYSGSGDKTVMEHNLVTGELNWTFSHAVGIVTAVCIYNKYLLCASYDKYIRCYSKKSRKLLKLYYGAGMGLITKMIVFNNMLITGNRKGLVEAVPLDNNENCSCEFECCNFIFGLREHLLKHVIYDHVTTTTKKFYCHWKECSETFSTENGKQEAEAHIRTHIWVEGT